VTLAHYSDEDQVECALVGLNLHFPDRGRSVQSANAKKVCGGCWLREQCVEGALSRREPSGIFGGMTARERHEEISRREGAEQVVPISHLRVRLRVA
jgi:hypothetical protein